MKSSHLLNFNSKTPEKTSFNFNRAIGYTKPGMLIQLDEIIFLSKITLLITNLCPHKILVYTLIKSGIVSKQPCALFVQNAIDQGR